MINVLPKTIHNELQACNLTLQATYLLGSKSSSSMSFSAGSDLEVSSDSFLLGSASSCEKQIQDILTNHMVGIFTI